MQAADYPRAAKAALVLAFFFYTNVNQLRCSLGASCSDETCSQFSTSALPRPHQKTTISGEKVLLAGGAGSRQSAHFRKQVSESELQPCPLPFYAGFLQATCFIPPPFTTYQSQPFLHQKLVCQSVSQTCSRDLGTAMLHGQCRFA